MHQKAQEINVFIKYLYKHQFIRYLFVGGTTFMLDEIGLIFLHGYLHLILPVATLLSFIVAFVYNFNLNRKWSFSAADSRSLKKHLKPYTLLFFFNLIFAVAFVSVASHVVNYAIAKALSVGIQTLWTFYIYKRYIFVTSTE